MSNIFLPLFIALPLAGAFLIPLVARLWHGLADIIANLITAALVGLSIYALTVLAYQPMVVYKLGGWPPPIGIVMGFDALSGLMVVTIAVISFAASLFSIRYLDSYTGRWKFYTLFMLIIAGLNGVAITGDIFNLFVFVEITSVASYALVAFGTRDEELEAGFKYMVISEVGGMTLLLALALIYAKASTLNMADLARIISLHGMSPFFWFVLGLLVITFAIKAALVPFHSWLPDAHPAAPTPVSAILSGVYIKVLGVYALSRIVFNVFGLHRANAPVFFNLLLILGLVSIVVGAFLALSQKDYKRLLAYSSISQVGYIIVGFGIGNYWGVLGALFHILAHALNKSLLFLTSGSVDRALRTRDLDKMGGLEKKMPVTAWSFIVGSTSLAGLPPLVGFFSKLLIVLGALAAKMYLVAVAVVLLSVVTLGYFLKIIKQAFFGKEATEGAHEAPLAMALPMIMLAVLAVACGLGYFWLTKFVVGPAADALLRGIDYARLIFGG